MNVMKTDFINLFNTDLDLEGMSKDLLSIHEDGKSMQDKFNTRPNAESPESELFFSPIKRVKWRGFRNASKK